MGSLMMSTARTGDRTVFLESLGSWSLLLILTKLRLVLSELSTLAPSLSQYTRLLLTTSMETFLVTISTCLPSSREE